jgi:mRNA interferase MazF
MNKGDIVFLPFPFTDLSGNKIRPALVLVVNELDVTVAFISTQFHWKEEHDIVIQSDIETGLKKESIVRLSKITTIDKDLVFGKLGQINASIIEIVNSNLRVIFQLN